MNKLFFVFAALLVSSFAFANNYPTVEINGVAHYLVNEDESTGEEWWSEDGYCVKKGFEWAATSSAQILASLSPLVAMNDEGNVEKTFSTNNGNLWVITSLVCE